MDFEIKSSIDKQNDFIEFYRDKALRHERYAIGFLISGLLLAIAGVIISINIYNLNITKLQDFKQKIDTKRHENNILETEIKNINTELGEIDYEYNKIKELDKLHLLIKEKEKKLSNPDKYDIVESLTNNSAYKEKLFYPDGKINIESQMLKNKNQQINNSINIKEKLLAEKKGQYKEKDTNLKIEIEIEKIEKEISALKTEIELLEFLQLKINNSNLDERKQSDKQIIKKYLIDINYFTFISMNENYSNDFLKDEIAQLKLKRKLLLLEDKKRFIEKNILELETQLFELEKQPLSQGEIVSIAFQFLYKIAFILTLELIAFFLLKQYRFSLDESRYFNNLLRDNERNILLLSILKDEKDKKVKEKLYSHITFQSSGSKLSSGESTEFIEIKKLSKEDENLISKTLDIIKNLFQK